MAETRFARGDALTVEHWQKLLSRDIVYSTPISSMIGTDPGSIIQLKEETGRGDGDKINFFIQAKLSEGGFTEGQLATGQGETLSIFEDSLLINETGKVVSIPTKGRSIDAQRVPIDLYEAANWGLKAWYGEMLSKVFFNQVCGYTPITDPIYKGHNTITSPTRHLFVGSNSADEQLNSDDVFDLRYIDYAKELAETADAPVAPINIKGMNGGMDIDDEQKFVMYFDPRQVVDLRTNTATGQWFDIQKAAIQGGEISKNPIYSGAFGEYNGVILKKANHVTPGVNSSTGASISTVRRAVLLGAQAACVGYGMGESKTKMKIHVEKYDHDRKREISGLTLMGLKKTVFTRDGSATDHGVVVVSSYAAAHT
jgi:N4-gp56 family major capsid protein